MLTTDDESGRSGYEGDGNPPEIVDGHKKR